MTKMARSLYTGGLAMLALCLLESTTIASEIRSDRTVYVACPMIFPEKDGRGGILWLSGVNIWDFLSEQIPNPRPPDWEISGDGPWILQCLYGQGRELTIDLPPQVTACWVKQDKQGQLSGYCTGPKTKEPVRAPALHVARKLDTAATLHGFGLGQTLPEVEEVAAKQGAKPRSRPSTTGRRRRFPSLPAKRFGSPSPRTAVRAKWRGP